MFAIITQKKIKGTGESESRPDFSKILFVVHKQNEDHYAACIQSIQELEIPAGKTLEILSWTGDNTTVSCSQLYNTIIRKKDAKYKIYIPDTTCFVYERALIDMLEIFAFDDEVAALGICGVKSLSIHDTKKQANNKWGAVYTLQNDGSVAEKRYAMPLERYRYVQCVSDVMLATQYDMGCDDAADNNSYAIKYSHEAIRQGYKIAVPRQAVIWCLSTSQ